METPGPHDFRRLLGELARLRPFRAVVVGDFMLDQQIRGAAERLSPDAPVPVLSARSHRDVTSTPGGASNVALCLAALGADVRCVGVLGDDAEAGTLRDALRDARIGVDGLVADASRPTTVKRSLVGLAQHRHPQKMFRLDFESRDPVSDAVADALLAAFDAALADADVVCLEDYGKGVCSEAICRGVIERARERGVPVLVDPASGADFERYARATAITPNRSEAESATGVPVPERATFEHCASLATTLRDRLDLDAVVLTLDRDGAMLARRGTTPVQVPTMARAVYDVTGAGDMVLAALAAAIAGGLEWIDGVRFANAAAGLEVETFGVRPIPLAEIRRSLLVASRGADDRVRTREELLLELEVHRESGRRIVLTNGCFDVIHAGHVAYLREARSLGDVLVVGINSDEQVRSLKGPERPIFSERERLEILGELRCVDYLTVFGEPTAHELIRAVRPDIYVKGGDYRPEEVAEHGLVQELGLDLRLLAHRPGLGSSAIIDRIRTTPG